MGRVSRDARLLFLQLWTLCDDSGRARGNSRMLASLLFPYDNDAPALIDDWIGELVDEGCIVRYVADGTTYIEVRNWLKHQKIDKPSPSRFPAFDESSRILANPREVSCEDQGPRTKDQGRDQGREKTTSSAKASSTDEKFETFWSAYPKKTGKEAARKSWARVPKPSETLQAILKALVWQRESEQWSKDGGQFIPNPATYLNQQRWLDEPPAQSVSGLSRFGRQSAAAAERWLQGQELSDGESHA